MVAAYPLWSNTSHSCRCLKLPNKLTPFITHSSFQNPIPQNHRSKHLLNNSLLFDSCDPNQNQLSEIIKGFEDNTSKLKHPDAKSSPLLKISHVLKLAKSLDLCDPNDENQVYEIINGFGGNVRESSAGLILNNMVNHDNAMIVFKYFTQKFEPDKQVILYNVMLKMFKESKDFEKAEKLFDEMLQRMIKPDVITFSTMISCAALYKVLKWLKMMSLFGCEPDDKLLSTMISSYAKIPNVDAASRLYRLAKKEKWKVDNMVFSALIKMYGKSRNCDQCLSVYHDMKVFGVKPNMITYHNLLVAFGKGKRARETKAIYKEMINSGISPSLSTYRAVLLAYCRRMYKVDALSVYKEMKKKGMGISIFQYNMLLDMCADVGYADEAVEIFQDMKSSGTCHPDTDTYTSLIKIYCRIGKVSEAETMFNEMMNSEFKPNILVLTSLAGCYGKAKQTDDVVRIFNQLLYVVMTEMPKQEHGKITDCIEKGNPKLGFVVRYLMEERDGDENFRKEASELFNSIKDKLIKTSLWNCLIDLCVNLEVPNRTRDLLNLGLTLDIYTNMQNRSPTMWSLPLKRLSTGTALTALHVWINDLSKALESGEELPPVLGIYTGKNKSLLRVIGPYLIEHNAPFQKNSDLAGSGWFVTTSEAVKSWLQSRGSSDIV